MAPRIDDRLGRRRVPIPIRIPILVFDSAVLIPGLVWAGEQIQCFHNVVDTAEVSILEPSEVARRLFGTSELCREFLAAHETRDGLLVQDVRRLGLQAAQTQQRYRREPGEPREI